MSENEIVEPVETPEVTPEAKPEVAEAVTPEERLANSQDALKKAIGEAPQNLDKEQRFEIDLTDEEAEEKPEDKKPTDEKPKEKPEPKVEPEPEPEPEPEKPDVQKEFNDLKAKHKTLNDDYANNLNLLNYAAKHKPEVLEKFYADIAGISMESKGLPGINRQEKPAEPAKSPLEGQINPATEEPYTAEEIALMNKNFENIASGLGFVKQSDIQADRDKAETQRLQKTAIKNVGDFKKVWSEKTNKMGLDWDTQVDPAMSVVLSRWGVRAGDFDKVTPENLSDAFNAMMMNQPGGMNMIIESAKADALKEDKNKRNKGKTIPSKGPKPTGQFDSKSFLEDFKKAPLAEKRRVAAKMIETAQKGLRNPVG